MNNSERGSRNEQIKERKNQIETKYLSWIILEVRGLKYRSEDLK